MILTQQLQKYVNSSTPDYFENLARESTKGRNDMSRLNDSFMRRVEIELEYAKNIENVIQELTQNDCAVNLEKIFNVYCDELKGQVKQARDVAYFIRDNIINKINVLIKDQTNAVRILIQDGRKLLTQLNSERNDIEKQMAQLIAKNQEYFNHQVQKYSQENLSSMTSQKRNDNTMKSDKLYRLQKELREKLRIQDQGYQQFLQGFDLRLSKIIEDLQQQDIERVEATKSIMIKLLNDRIINVLTSLNQKISLLETELSLYKYKDQYIKSFQIDYSETKNFISESIKKTEENWVDNVNNFLQKCQNHKCDRNQITLNMDLLKQDTSEINILINQHDQDLITSVQICQETIHLEMQEIWGSNQINLHALINLLQKSSIGRQIWIHKFSSFRIEKRFELSPQSFFNTINLLCTILNICQEEFDAYTVRKLILMAFTFFKFEKGEKVFLSHGIKEHKIFESLDLWDTIFFESLYEEMKKQQTMRVNEEMNDSINREKNTIFGFSGSLIENMLSLGQQKTNAKQLVLKYSKLYMLSEIHTKQLIQIIDGWKAFN